MTQILIGLLILSCSSLYAQDLFESAQIKENDQDKEMGIDLSGYVRGSLFGGGQNYDYSTLFGETSIKGKLFYNKTFLYTEIRLTSGLEFNETFTQFDLREAYAGYSGKKYL